ncbi:MAG: hypothetical protein AAF394_14255 [Planctomycetota bacterium]
MQTKEDYLGADSQAPYTAWSDSRNAEFLELLRRLEPVDCDVIDQTIEELQDRLGDSPTLQQVCEALIRKGLLSRRQILRLKEFATQIQQATRVTTSRHSSSAHKHESDYDRAIRESWEPKSMLQSLAEWTDLIPWRESLNRLSHFRSVPWQAWTALASTIVLLAAWVFWPTQTEVPQHVANQTSVAGEAKESLSLESAKPRETDEVELTPVLALVLAEKYGPALKALEDWSEKQDMSADAESETQLVKTALQMAAGETEASPTRTLCQASQMTSSIWLEVYSQWLIQSGQTDRRALLEFLDSLEGPDESNALMLYRLKAWLKSRDGDPTFALHYLNQLDASDASSGDLLFRASAQLQSRAGAAALEDLTALEAMLDETQNEPSLLGIVQALSRNRILKMLPRLQETGLKLAGRN